MLPHATKGYTQNTDVNKGVEATRIAKELYPALKLDGDLQLDVALVTEVAFSKAPGNEVEGKENVLDVPVFGGRKYWVQAGSETG